MSENDERKRKCSSHRKPKTFFLKKLFQPHNTTEWKVLFKGNVVVFMCDEICGKDEKHE